MADRYWIATGAATTANTASNWNTAADGTGSTGVPATNDTVIFGHADSFANDLGTAPCTWDLAVTLTRMQTLANYNAIEIEDDDGVAFDSTGKTFTFENNNPEDLGFKAGMKITVAGSTSNNGTFTISSVADDVIVVVEAVTDEAAGQSVTVTYDTYIDLQADISLTRLDLDCHLKNTSGSNKNITISGTYPASNCYVFNDSNAQISNTEHIAYVFDSSANTPVRMVFSNGPYPQVSLGGTNAYYSPASGVTTTADAEITMHSLSIGANAFFNPDPSTVAPRDDARKKFVIGTTGFSLSCDKFDMGLATLEFQLDGNFELPVTGSATYGDADKTFIVNYRDLIITTATAGRKATVPEDRTLSVNSLLIGPDAVLEGYSTKDNHKTSTVISVSRPSILGAWNFSQLSDGVYVSLMDDAFPITPSDGPAGRVQLSNDGGTFTSDGALKFDAATGELRATKFVGDGSLLTNLPSGGGAVSSVFGRTGAVVATEGDYDLDELGDVDVTSAVETQILRHDGTSFVNEYNDIFFLRVKAREAISKGEAVYIFDAHNSNVVGVKKARADSASTMPCIGVAYETLALGDEGLIVAFGKANGIAASFTEGETMYVSPTTAGALTNTKPTGNTQLIQNVGILMQAHASNAVVKVTGVGRTNDVPNQFSVTGSITASALVTSGGSVNDFVKGDGSLDSTPYLTTETDPVVGGINGIVKADGLGTISPAVPFVDYVQTETDPIATPLAIANTNSINDINTKSHMWLTKAAPQPYTPAATPAVIQYDTPQYDTGGDFDPINYAFVAPRSGYYLVDVGFYLAATPTWSFSMVYKSTNGGASWSYVMRNVSGSGQQNKLVNVLHLNAGDMIAHYANSSNTGTINVSVTSLTYFRVAEMIG